MNIYLKVSVDKFSADHFISLRECIVLYDSIHVAVPSNFMEQKYH